MEYRLQANARVSKDGEKIIIAIAIERSKDGEEFELATLFEHRYGKEVTNPAIIKDVKRRVQEFVLADSNVIAGAALSERAANLSDAISGTRISV